VAFAVLESPFASFEEIENYTLQTFYKLPVSVFGTAFDYKLTHSDAAFTADDLELASHLTGNETLPVIFLGGTADDYIPFEQTQALYDVYAGQKLLISDDVRHSIVNVTKEAEIKEAVQEYAKTYGCE
jgi:alpha-beta hydrolase superfamily lysophospholipase